ncbi:glutathione S-transferase family protein [Pseudohoeflea coraliihabitans]|uniref:Glutathione S-transferase N-terminal domain-containing protein n=1 Tax=Pseudohoeflea coraliihabitans TaxID=2860393 RepID=A0ABS6WSW5_9HYPH|nr:glutathione S-transferase N-terminal domain-containing protein [Pseudohoeflea sp. DP4N28-3]MBW3098733.1 glutathione S-transferase N-terminal domain-containing protein [Pseudohoeflea sp. DP4N28-3]
MPMKLYSAPASPYAAKARMGAVVAGLPVEITNVSTASEPADLIDTNPLGKIPTLLNDDGVNIYDSRAIMQYLDRAGGRKLYPRNAAKRTEAEVTEALCDGICDALLLIVYERRYRSEELVHQPWLDLQWRKVTRGLEVLEKRLPRMGKSPTAAHLAIAAVLGYLNLRFEGQWERGRPKLKAFMRKFEANFPDLARLCPQAD